MQKQIDNLTADNEDLERILESGDIDGYMERLAREEYNLPLNKEAYEHLIKKADGNIITKKRYEIPDGNGYTIELDIFEGLFAGTILAEVEFPTIEAANSYSAPSWFIDDVTNDPAYHNSNMSRKVF